MPKKTGILFISLGAVLILSALLLFLHNQWEDFRAGQDAEMQLQEVQAAVLEKVDPATPLPTDPEPALPEEDMPEELPENEPEAPPAEMAEPKTTVTVDGYEYIGYLSIPALGLELPIMADWDYERLKIAPCRHFGSSGTDDLVIAGHNYKTHFKYLSNLKAGAEILFTDANGNANQYVLVRDPELLAPDEVDAVQNSGYDLVLYTCTPGRTARVVVFCDRVAQDTE